MAKSISAAAGTALATVILYSVPVQAVTLQTDEFISNPTYFNGFEAISSSPNFQSDFVYPNNTPYTEGGITVAAIVNRIAREAEDILTRKLQRLVLRN
jgi:hypothetical protein